ncbi:murein biosynthesis integral membrane protein MurJ [Candidatus Comchoanobacter bicostacola]|uniref:Murein biosynthesis integral membrane protein MurJ n=1 Tax=Candidatus Comchoanobacter bicostacola TaxID=2919598 RepID=A0ABY5DII2_9GAMM|nr:murein biosynthesis integral membrane protein MurJ [Candidatus Comchoanobacter bicostacola]UTC24420.1 murein biosynthesis integral membrane protein MurJ [Candidatus Comchoanobacter bicostacola]
MKRQLINNASITLCSRLLGFARDFLFARYMGPSLDLDAFILAFKIPNMFRRFLAEGVFMQSMVPAVTSASSPEAFKRSLLTGWLLVLSIFSFVFMLGVDHILPHILPGLDLNSDLYQKVLSIMPWVFPYLFMISLCGFYTVQLNMSNQLWPTSVMPVILNIGFVTGLLYFPLTANMLAKVVFVSGVLQLALCLYLCKAKQQVIVPSRFMMNGEMKQLMLNVSHGFLAQLMQYLSSIVELWFLSFLAVGSVSWLYFAERLVQMPLGVFSVTLANLLLPRISKSIHNNHIAQFYESLSYGVNVSLAFAIPSMCGLYLVADSIATVFFKDSIDIVSVTSALKISSLALPAFMLSKLLTAAAFAKKRTDQVFWVTLCAFVVNVGMCYSLISRYGYLAIPMATFISAWLQCILFWRALSLHPLRKVKLLKPTVCSTLSMCLAITMLKYNFSFMSVRAIFELLFQIVSGIVVYQIVLKQFGYTLWGILEFK